MNITNSTGENMQQQTVTVGSLCYQLGEINNWDEFDAKVTNIVKRAKAQNVDILLFPELFTIDLMAAINYVEMPELWLAVEQFTPSFHQMIESLANQYDIWIIGGSHVQKHDRVYRNTASLYGPNTPRQDYSKSHLFGGEKALGEVGGDSLSAFDTPFGKVGIQICYDIQFPEPSRIIADQGIDILFCPAYTVGEQGYWRVRHCCHARAVENTVYVVLSSTIGQVERSTIGPGWGQSVVTSPSGVLFPAKGLVSQGGENDTTLLVTELDLTLLQQYRQAGETDPANDKRRDLYSLKGL